MFKNLKITAKMKNHTAASEHLRLDCILSAAKAKELLHDDYYFNPKIAGDKQIIIDTLSEFLKYDEKSGIFHASCGIGNGREFVTSFSKRFNSADDELINFQGKGKQIIDTSRGFFKSYHKAIITKAYDEIVFYANGDKDEIERLLDVYIHYIGKKTSQGFGAINYWRVTELHEDFSLMCDGKALRFLPVQHFDKQIRYNREYVREAALIPPAWRSDCVELCFMPEL